MLLILMRIDFAVITRAAARIDSSILSGFMVVCTEKRTLHLLSFKEVFAILESESIRDEAVKLNVSRTILTSEDVAVISTVAPDCIFTASSHLTLYLLKDQ